MQPTRGPNDRVRQTTSITVEHAGPDFTTRDFTIKSGMAAFGLTLKDAEDLMILLPVAISEHNQVKV